MVLLGQRLNLLLDDHQSLLLVLLFVHFLAQGLVGLHNIVPLVLRRLVGALIDLVLLLEGLESSPDFDGGGVRGHSEDFVRFLIHFLCVL